MGGRLWAAIFLGAFVATAVPTGPAYGGAARESMHGDTDEKTAARRRAMERRRAEAARQRAAQRRSDEARRRAEEQTRMRARLRAEDGRRRAAARARVDELARKTRHRATLPTDPPLKTLRRVERAALGVDHVPSARHFRVHYDAGVCTAHYVTTINPLRYRGTARDHGPVFDPLAPNRGVVKIPAGLWSRRTTPGE